MPPKHNEIPRASATAALTKDRLVMVALVTEAAEMEATEIADLTGVIAEDRLATAEDEATGHKTVALMGRHAARSLHVTAARVAAQVKAHDLAVQKGAQAMPVARKIGHAEKIVVTGNVVATTAGSTTPLATCNVK